MWTCEDVNILQRLIILIPHRTGQCIQRESHTQSRWYTQQHMKNASGAFAIVSRLREGQKNVRMLQLKSPSPPKLSLLCVSIYAVKAERRNTCERIRQAQEKKAGGWRRVQVRAEAYNKDHECEMIYKAARLQQSSATPPTTTPPITLPTLTLSWLFGRKQV